jgi:hypothetical protein
MDKTALKSAIDTFKKRLAEAAKGENVGEDTKAAVDALLKDLKVARSNENNE